MNARPLKLLRVFWRMHKRKPTFLSINVTNRCNARCPMCAVWRTPCDELSLEELERIFSGLKKFGIMVVEVSGGEPFLREDIFDIFSLLDRTGLLYTVTSNGAVLTPEHIRRIPEARGMLQLAISLDSLNPELYGRLREKDALPAVLNNIDRLCEAGLRAPLKINFTMSRLNYRETFEMLDFARSRCIYMSAFPVNQGEGFCHRSGHSVFSADDEERRRMSEIFLQLAKQRRAGEPLWEYSGFYKLAADFVAGRAPGYCDAGRLYLDVHADGKMAVCIDQPPFADLRKERIADVRDRIRSRHDEIRRCYTETPCIYTCTSNISLTARHELAFLAESVLVRMRMKTRCPEGPAGKTAGASSAIDVKGKNEK